MKNLIKSALGTVSLESTKLTSDVVIGSPQTLITLKDAIISAKEDYEASEHIEEEIAEFGNVQESLESMHRIAVSYVRDGGMTPELARVYSKSFDHLVSSVGIEALGLSKISFESFAADPLTASLEAVEETETAKITLTEKTFTKIKTLVAHLEGFLSSYNRIGSTIVDTADDLEERVKDYNPEGKQIALAKFAPHFHKGGEFSGDVGAALRELLTVAKKISLFTDRCHLEVDDLLKKAIAGEYQKDGYKEVFADLNKIIGDEYIPGGRKFLVKKEGDVVLRLSKPGDTDEAKEIDAPDAKTLSIILKEAKSCGEFISSYSNTLNELEKKIVSAVRAAEKRLGTKLDASFLAYCTDLNSIVAASRGPGPDFLHHLGVVSKAALEFVNKATK